MNFNQTISVFVLMKQRVSALTVQSILSSERDIEVIVLDKKFSNLNQLFDFSPDIVITDMETCSRQPAKSFAALREKCNTRFLFLYAASHDSTSAAVRAGADGLISKSSPSHELAAAVRALADGKCWIDELIWRDYLKQGNRQKTGEDSSIIPHEDLIPSREVMADSVPALTKKETEVLRLAALGFSNQQIALSMELSLETINCYMWLIAKKLHARGRVHAVDVARQSGIFS
jgi:DNA-binding NarL/FixJ family response regulator